MAFKIDWKWIISILVAILPFIYSMNLFQKDKQLSYEIQQTITKQIINGVNNENIVYGVKNGTETYITEKLSVITIRFINSGKVPIQRSDFDTPITITLQNAKKVFQPQINSIKPKDLHIDFLLKGNSIQINKMLLNPEDEFTMTLIVDGNVDKIIPSARIIGITELTPILEKRKEDISYSKFFLGFIFFIYLGKYLADILIDTKKRIKDFLMYLPAIFIMEIAAIYFTKSNMIFDVSKTTYSIASTAIFLISFYFFKIIFPKDPICPLTEVENSTIEKVVN